MSEATGRMQRSLGRVIREEETRLQLSHSFGEMSAPVLTDGENMTVAGVIGFKYYCHDLCNSDAGIQTAMNWLDRGALLPPLLLTTGPVCSSI
ncbi:hypothetical protein BgiBS90_017895 [Biomphalaria glabrata]|nr:hypothetical protein BgiBS90_017895 [Biomphalaria glabrata]